VSARELNLEDDFTLIDCLSRAEFRQYIQWTAHAGLISWSGASVSLDDNGMPMVGREVVASLTMAGWNRVQPLPRPGGIPGRCFVAIWFSDQTRGAYESGIEPAVKEAGFTLIRIDQKEHNNEIPDEIMAEIRDCQLMVADFTGQRAGVYYEAGFAMGLGRPVIWCCRKDEISKLHFDTNHKNHIVWTTPEELREGLYRRIRATILDVG
jgi:nucleoside 2-deoxyribosyltransferase